jgi:restriction system protein
MAKISRTRAAQYVKTALQVLEDNDDSLRARDVFARVSDKLELSEYELERYEKTNNVRWESALSFYSISPVKAGWLIKNKGVWYLTPEGKEVTKLPDEQFAALSKQKYNDWKKRQSVDESQAKDQELDIDAEELIDNSSVTFEKASSDAYSEIEAFIEDMGPYEFQDLVAALLRAMGYFTPFIAPKGKDGGIDIQAYKDPLGTTPPRIITQVKQRPETKASVMEIRELGGLLRRDGDVGLFVATGGFSKDAIAESTNAIRHIELVDLKRFVDLWQEHYENMSEEDKSLMPLREILFLSPER